MSTLAVNTITDEPGTGAVEFPLMPTVNGNAIIERGSNANGEYVKYADGTMICTSEAAAVSVNSISNASSGTLLSTVTFPATFAAAPVCQVLPAASNTSSDARASIVLFAGIATTTALSQIYAWNRNNYTASATPTFRVQTVAIGRWF
jgi:hypothetical protein